MSSLNPNVANPSVHATMLGVSDTVVIFKDRGYQSLDGYLTFVKPEQIDEGMLLPAKSITAYMDKKGMLALADWLKAKAERG